MERDVNIKVNVLVSQFKFKFHQTGIKYLYSLLAGVPDDGSI
jgi:hypothetical protein